MPSRRVRISIGMPKDTGKPIGPAIKATALCDRCHKPGTPENPVKPGPFSGVPKHARGCTAVHGPKIGRG